jgi:hypothetical protein
MVFGSRGLNFYEKNDLVIIENLSEHLISSLSDFKSHLHHSFQIRKSITKPDPKLKLKSSFVVFFSLYENSVFYSQFGLVELPGSENASNDQSIMKANSLTTDEKKAIARSFNALSAVLSHQNLFKESSLTLACKVQLLGNVSVICTITPSPSHFKHTLAALKYSKRLKEAPYLKLQQLKQDLKDELFRIRSELKEAKFITADWADSRQKALTRIENLIASNKALMGSASECEEFLLECSILKKQLQALRTRPAPPLPTEPIRRRSASPINDNSDCLLRQKIASLQSQNEMQLRKIEEVTNQVSFRDSDIKVLHSRVAELEKAVFEKDRVIQELEARINEYSGKLSDYCKKVKALSSKNISSAQLRNAREEILEDRIVELEDRISKEREEAGVALQKMKMNLQTKERIIQELQTSSNSCISEKDLKVQELKQKLKSKGIIIADLEKQVVSLNNGYNEARYKLEISLNSAKRSEDECLLLRKRVEELNSRNCSIESKNLLLLQKSDSLEKDLNSALQEVDSRKYKSQQLSSTLKEMENTMNISTEEVARMRFELNQLRSENQSLRVEKENIIYENSQVREENIGLKSELKQVSSQFEETNNFLKEKDSQLQGLSNEHPMMRHKKKKILNMKETITNLQQQLKDCQSLAEKEIKTAVDERDQALAELEEARNSQNHDLSLVENQVNLIEEQLLKLKEQNKLLQGREAELLKELKNSETGKEKYKETIVDLKDQVKSLQNQLADMDEFTKEYIETHRKEIKEMKLGEEKAVVLKSRIRAMHDVKNMILAHRAKSNN